MRRLLIPLFMMLLMFSRVTSGQGNQMIDNFDASAGDATYQNLVEAPSSMEDADDPSTKVEGSGSLQIKAVIASDIHGWGSYAQLQKRLPDGEVLDWSASDTLRLWMKIIQAPAEPANVVFRIHIADRPAPTDNIEEYIFEHATALDVVGEWFELKVPMNEREADTGNPDDTGIILFPASWSRSASQENNKVLDADKIVGYNISFITTTAAADSVIFNVDNFQATGYKAVPLVVFNGLVWASDVSNTWSWGQSSIEIVPGAGPVQGSAAVKWTQGNEYGNGWSGIGTDIKNFDLGGAWPVDSVKFKLKAEEGVGALRVQLESGADGKVGTVFTPIADNQWHDYSFALREMIPQDNTTNFNPANIISAGMMAEASAVAGKVVYLTDWWTGNPEFDVIPPIAPAGVAAIADDKQNIVTWTDVPGEESEKYDVYYSTSPITDVTAKGVESVATGIPGGEQVAEHVLLYPLVDQSVSYYYAVVCRDGDGNVGPVSESSAPVTNTARGVPTIDLTVPTNFTADGDLSEWAQVNKIRLSISEGTAFLAPNQQIDNNADLSLDVFLAIDNDYLYVAFDVEDDIVSTDVATNTYENDSPDLFLGLYDWHGAPHSGYKRGAEPDYHFRFIRERAFIDGGGANADSLLLPGADYYWEESFPTGYVVEARISLANLAAAMGDDVYVPENGNRIPIDFSINDADGAPREGILCYSKNNDDQSWSTPSRWTYTWIGDQVSGVNEDKISLDTYQLLQNYPNPFNPSTQISYVLKNAGQVTLKVYDMLGREVATLVDGFQNSGIQTVNFDASNLASGMYLYQIDSGDFHSVKKMLFLK